MVFRSNFVSSSPFHFISIYLREESLEQNVCYDLITSEHTAVFLEPRTPLSWVWLMQKKKKNREWESLLV